MSVDPVSLAITLALNAASMALTASKKIEGPRLDDLKASTADYGSPLVQFYGTSRLECICIYAENLREQKHKNKTKGGKYTEYKYFGTWASFVADCPTGPIDDVLTIWLDRHIAYDIAGEGGAVEAGYGGFNFRIYKGTADQMPDARLLAKIEAKEGAGTCPAYRNMAYIVFEEVPLEKFGNRLPQVSVLATRNKVPSYPWKFTTGLLTSAMQVSREVGRVYLLDGESVEIWDAATQTRLLNETIFGLGISNHYAIVPGDGIYCTHITGSAFYFVGLDGGGRVLTPIFGVGAPAAGWFGGMFYAGGLILLAPGSFSGPYIGFMSSGGGSITAIPANFYASHYFTDVDGDAVAVGYPDASGALHQLAIDPGLTGMATLIDTTAYGTSGAAYGFDNGSEYVVRQGTYLYRIDKGTLTITQAQSAPLGSTAFVVSNWNSITPGAADFWDDVFHFSATDLSVISTENLANWPVTHLASETNGVAYEPTTRSLLSLHTFGDPGITWRFIRSGGGGWTLGDICADVAEQVDMDPLRYDFSDLDQDIAGYAWTQGAGKDIVGPLLELHDSDIRPHNFIQQGLKRGQPYSGPPITTEWMVNESRGQDAAQQPLYSIPETAETDLPLRVAATFADPNMEDQPNTVHAQRNQASVKTSREQSFDLTTMRGEPEIVQGLIERALRRYWVGAAKPAFMLTPLELRLEPADVRPLVLEDGELLRVRATRMTIRANRVIETEWEVDGETQVNPPDWTLDDASPLNTVYSTPGGFTYGRPPDTILVPIPTKGWVFDTPLVTDADDQTAPFLYDAAAPFAADVSWFGAMVFTADDNEADTVYSGGWDSFTSSEPSVWGQIVSGGPLPDAVTDVMDEVSALVVQLKGGGALSSTTTDALLADQSLNLALIGSELVQFRDADPLGDDQYEISGFIRGARNTEYAATGHVSGENFLLIGSNRHRRTVGASEIGDTDFYKFSSTGDDIDAVTPIAVPFQANAHRPPTVAHLALERDYGTGDWTISWIRRTRIGGGAVNGQDVPLGEVSELYRVKIMSGASVLATYEVTTNSRVYTAAEQVADWGGAQTSLTVEVCQMSPALSLEGFTSTASA